MGLIEQWSKIPHEPYVRAVRLVLEEVGARDGLVLKRAVV